jgi:hypothetical protein
VHRDVAAFSGGPNVVVAGGYQKGITLITAIATATCDGVQGDVCACLRHISPD